MIELRGCLWVALVMAYNVVGCWPGCVNELFGAVMQGARGERRARKKGNWFGDTEAHALTMTARDCETGWHHLRKHQESDGHRFGCCGCLRVDVWIWVRGGVCE